MPSLKTFFICIVVVNGFSSPNFRDKVRVSLVTPGRVEAQQESPTSWMSKFRTIVATAALMPSLWGAPLKVHADDELARYAAEGNKVAVDGQCFLKKCALETTKCANDKNCLKGLACLARCKGGSLCSTGCFAKFGSDDLDGILACSVEKNDCVQVPGKENNGWTSDTLKDLPSKPISNFDIASLDGTWYKVMGLDSRYDCFDCQRNKFEVEGKDALKMEALFRIPRPTFPGYLQNKIVEELRAGEAPITVKRPQTDAVRANMHSQGQMFGLTFWENWYILGESKPTVAAKFIPKALAMGREKDLPPDMKLVFYTGHTLQGSYKGAFLYSRSPILTRGILENAKEVIRRAGLNPEDFCVIRNQCFLTRNQGETASASTVASASTQDNAPFWILGQNFFRATKTVAEELADWFEDPAILSDWLYSQQQHMMLEQPLAVSPFAGEEVL